MGLSLLLAIVGLVIVILGVVFLVMRKQQKITIACLIVGLLLILVPYIYIHVFLD
jgi:hypothetical protein